MANSSASGVMYCLEFPNGKKYIGISRNIDARWADHAKPSRQSLVSRAIRKYGKENIKKTILCKGEMNYLMQMEIKAIAAYGTRNKDIGYNVSEGGELSPSVVPEVAKKISESKKGHLVSEETREKLRKSAFAQATHESRKASSERSKLQFSSAEARKKMSDSCKKAWSGKSEDQRLKAVAFSSTPEGRAILSASSKAYNSTPEAKALNSEDKKARWKDPEWREKVIAAQKAGRERAKQHV